MTHPQKPTPPTRTDFEEKKGEKQPPNYPTWLAEAATTQTFFWSVPFMGIFPHFQQHLGKAVVKYFREIATSLNSFLLLGNFDPKDFLASGK